MSQTHASESVERFQAAHAGLMKAQYMPEQAAELQVIIEEMYDVLHQQTTEIERKIEDLEARKQELEDGWQAARDEYSEALQQLPAGDEELNIQRAKTNIALYQERHLQAAKEKREADAAFDSAFQEANSPNNSTRDDMTALADVRRRVVSAAFQLEKAAQDLDRKKASLERSFEAVAVNHLS